MTLTVRKNGSLFPTLVNEFFERDRLLPDLLDLESTLLNRWSTDFRVPSANIIENTKDFKIELAAPGLEKKDFKIEVDNDYLTISAEKEEEKKEEKEDFRRREFSYNSFSRSFLLPDNTLSDKIDAKYEDGILRLSIPKKEVTVTKTKKEITVA
ncbi:MAG: Hsp20/alpha crystallin family protein [Bacteroidota bacterium]|nr:Hsp20/alpha crystallin family protein [Bacteroidota bacterium]